jgi:hypothetical protein
MTTPAYPETGEQAPDYPPAVEPNCDPEVLDDYTCAAKGIQEQAAYNAAHLQALDAARTQYKGARKAYGAAWDTARPLLVESRKQLDKLIEQLECLIDKAQTVHRLRRAFDRVEERLEKCGDLSGCYCRTDCDYDDEVRDCPSEELAARIADIEGRTKEAEACFADLIQEPTKLTERVTTVRAEIADIATKVSGNPLTTDFVRLYAAALVARRHLMAVQRGFDDVNAYVDCICKVLTCMLKGHAAIAELKRRQAVHNCYRDGKVAACELLKTTTVDEVISEYLKIAVGYAEGEDEPEGYGGREPEAYGNADPGEGHEPERRDDRPGGDQSRSRVPDGGDRPGGDRPGYRRPDGGSDHDRPGGDPPGYRRPEGGTDDDHYRRRDDDRDRGRGMPWR